MCSIHVCKLGDKAKALAATALNEESKKASRENVPPPFGKDGGREMSLHSEGNPKRERNQGGTGYWKIVGIGMIVEGLAGFPLVVYKNKFFSCDRDFQEPLLAFKYVI